MMVFPTTLAPVLAMMVVVWLLSLASRDVSLVNPFWGTSFVLVAWAAYALTPDEAPRRLLVCVMTTVWEVACGFC